MTELVLIRHGQASVDAADYDRLSTIGIEQSRLLGVWMGQCGWAPDAVVVGGRRRQLETASAPLRAMGLAREIETDPAFDEFDHRAILLACRPALADRAVLARELKERSHFRALLAAAIARWMSGEHDDYPESWDAFRARVRAGIARLGARELASVWVFTSAGPISACVGETIGVAPPRIAELTASIMNASITRLTHENRPRLASFNATPHLDRADRSLMTLL